MAAASTITGTPRACATATASGSVSPTRGSVRLIRNATAAVLSVIAPSSSSGRHSFMVPTSTNFAPANR